MDTRDFLLKLQILLQAHTLSLLGRKEFSFCFLIPHSSARPVPWSSSIKKPKVYLVFRDVLQDLCVHQMCPSLSGSFCFPSPMGMVRLNLEDH